MEIDGSVSRSLSYLHKVAPILMVYSRYIIYTPWAETGESLSNPDEFCSEIKQTPLRAEPAFLSWHRVEVEDGRLGRGVDFVVVGWFGSNLICFFSWLVHLSRSGMEDRAKFAKLEPVSFGLG